MGKKTNNETVRIIEKWLILPEGKENRHYESKCWTTTEEIARFILHGHT